MPTQSNSVVIIAEAGVNHNGQIENALELIAIAAEAGADYVKFQSFQAEELASVGADKASYQKNSTGDGSQLEMLKALQLSLEDHRLLAEECKRKDIGFLSTPFDRESLKMLIELGIDLVKVPSGEITNKRLLEAVAGSRLPIVLSTGMSTLGDIESALEILASGGAPITLLHCNTQYPTPMSDVNLRALGTLAAAFKLPVGLSDHTLGIEVSVAAVALGARVIEKHFTLDKTLPGPDHAASLEPCELKNMVKSIRNIAVALGHGIKRPSPSELVNIEVARRSIHAAFDLPAGHKLAEQDLSVKRPGSGISPMVIDQVIGLRLVRPVHRDSLISWADLGDSK